MPDTVMQTMEAPVFRNRSAEIKDLACALAKAQGAMENAKKDSENPGFKRDGKVAKYADLASVWDAIRKPLANNGLCVIQSPRTMEGGVEIETELLHESGQFMRAVLWLPCPTMTVHTVGSTITYGRRYALMSIVGIAPEDDDGNAAAEAHKPGAAGTARGGGDFRPPGPRRQSSWGEGGKQGVIEEAQRDGLTANAPAKGAAPAKTGPLGGREATPEEARKAKIKANTDMRVNALKGKTDWTRAGLDDFWKEHEVWIDWMSDPNNKQLVEYERFSKAFADAEMSIRPVELA